jgi:hypothetical protein
MASGPVARSLFFQQRFNGLAALGAKWAAGLEPAPWRRIERQKHLAP